VGGTSRAVFSSLDTIHYPRPYGKYQLLERIGRGGMADVFRARLPGIAGFEKTLVIKRLQPRFSSSPGFVQMFIDEAKLAAQVQHKNVVQVFELGTLDNGELFIAMEFVDGTDLKGLIAAARHRGLQIPVWLALYVAAEILDALSFAHDFTDGSGDSRNIVHNDVTPENIFLARRGDVKLGDFGVAQDSGRTSEPFPGRIKGKVPYMSPEQLSGARLDGKSDVFSLGIVLWEMLTRRHLFHAETSNETMARVCGGRRPPPSRFNPEVPAEVDAVVLAALSVDPGRRSSAKAMQGELLDLLGVLKGRVDAADVRAAVAPFLLGPDERIPDFHDEPLELDGGHDPLEESGVVAKAIPAADTAAHLLSSSNAREISEIAPAPTTGDWGDLADPELIAPPPPPPAPPPRRPAAGVLRSTGSIKDGFLYTVLHPDQARSADADERPAQPSDLDALDDLFRQFLDEKFSSGPRSWAKPGQEGSGAGPQRSGPEEAPKRPGITPGSVRRLLSAARELGPWAEKTPLPEPEAPHPFWVRYPNGREVGPMPPPVFLRYMAGRPAVDLTRALVSADQVRWLAMPRVVRLLSEALIPDDAGMRTCTFQGTLRGHSLTSVLGELGRTGATGRLVMLRKDEHDHIDRRELHIRDGALTATSHNATTFAMWEGLLSSPFFTQLHLQDSLYAAVQLQRPVQELLASDAAACLVQYRALMARRQLREIFTWSAAHFGFDPESEPIPGQAHPLLRLLPRMVARTMSRAQLRASVDRYMDTPLVRSSDFDEVLGALDLRTTDLERIEPLGHGYTLGEALAQAAPLADDHYALVISYVLLELGLLKRARPQSGWAPPL